MRKHWAEWQSFESNCGPKNRIQAAARLILARDLKSPARKGVPVRFRLRAPSFNKGLRAKATQAFVHFRFPVFALSASGAMFEIRNCQPFADAEIATTTTRADT